MAVAALRDLSYLRLVSPSLAKGPLFTGTATTPSMTTTTSTMMTMGPRRWKGHLIRIIATKDLPYGKAYPGDVLTVKAGYARNYLIPQKMAVYATRQNFVRLQIKDPDLETPDEKRARLAAESKVGNDQDQRAADILRKYLRDKVLTIWRNADRATNSIMPGLVNARNVRNKLSRQLKIDLDPHERIHISPEPIVLDKETDLETLLVERSSSLPEDPEARCTVELRQLGNFLARIWLRGGHSIPLHFRIVKR